MNNTNDMAHVFLEAQKVDDALQSFASGLAGPPLYQEPHNPPMYTSAMSPTLVKPTNPDPTNAGQCPCTTTQRLSARISPQVQSYFNQADDHEEVPLMSDECKADYRSHITSTFLEAFFRFPINDPEECEVDYDLFLFLYENVVPRRCRQRPQEVAKIRIKKLESVLPAHTPTEKKLAKRTWAHQRHKKVVLQGLVGPEFYTNVEQFEALCQLVGRQMVFDRQSFLDMWEASRSLSEPPSTENKSKKRKTHDESPKEIVIPESRPHDVPYDIFESSPSTVVVAFDIPGVYEQPTFSLNKSARQFRLEGYKAPPPVYLNTPMIERQRWFGPFQVIGQIPVQVDLQVPPIMKMEAGLFLATFIKYNPATSSTVIHSLPAHGHMQHEAADPIDSLMLSLSPV